MMEETLNDNDGNSLFGEKAAIFFNGYCDDDSARPAPPDAGGRTVRCDKKCCKVGRNSGRFSSFVRHKMNFVDVSRIRPANSIKMCMKTRLVGEDCKPLLIRGSDDLMFPINDDIVSDGAASRQSKMSKDPGKLRRLLDGLARTFCLPLLG